MSKRTFDFLSSFGIMLVGLFAIFGGSILVQKPNVGAARHFPIAGPRHALVGGDAASTILPVSRPHTPIAKNNEPFTGDLSAATALVVDDITNAVLYDRGSNEPRPLASITKLMTALVLTDLPINWNMTTTVVAADIDSSSHQLIAGDVLSMDELWQVALIASANSAIKALVRGSGLTTEEFVARMNAKAQSLHLPTAHFVEPTGLDARNVASAWDTSRILKTAISEPRISRALATPEFYIRQAQGGKARRIWSTDWLLTSWVPNKFNKDDIVGKTGYIPESGYNFAVRLSAEGRHSLRVVVMGASSDTARFGEARDLAEWAFGHFTWPDEAGYDNLVE
jgi:D-alanyl-D-alanine endopeptidase (penicillin-binding protein 7)